MTDEMLVDLLMRVVPDDLRTYDELEEWLVKLLDESIFIVDRSAA